MPIPDFQSHMLPMLELAGDGTVHSLAEARDVLAARFGLTEVDRAELLPSGRQRRFDNRVAWAKVYLEQAGLLTTPKRGHFLVTENGRGLLKKRPERIDIGMLEQFEEFRDFRSRRTDSSPSQPHDASSEAVATPEETLESAYQSIRAQLAEELLARVKAASPSFLETLVVELLTRMGYGGGRADASRAIGGSGDEGIDGIINEDRLGLDVIYIQAKRWSGAVGRPELQKFVGALHGKRARKGVFITTGSFSADAREYVSRIDPRVVLIDGRALSLFMIDLNIGVTPRATYELKRLDSDFFAEEDAV
jgi:restriction system protein